MRTKTIVITGPESSGKTTLAQQLANYFSTQWVNEFAREYIDELDRPYQEDDLLEIAKGQFKKEKKAQEKANGLIFLDTSLEVIKIWSEHKYGHCHPWILQQLKNNPHDLYLLCQPDLPWEFDPQRESPNDRGTLFKLYLQELKQQNANFVEISGLNEHRSKKAIQHVESFILYPPHAYHA